jgi:phosphorylcholine metabolism protein LicD
MRAYWTGSPELPSLLLQSHGPRFIRDALDACRSAGIKPFIAFGTLLGHHRDGGFIKHDADIDFGILPEDFKKINVLVEMMIKKGYTVRINDDHEVSFYREHFPTLLVDFFLFHRVGNDLAYYDSRGDVQLEYRFAGEIFGELRAIKFLGYIDAWIPDGVESFLEASYGDWRTPKAKFDNVHDHPNLTVMNPVQ